MRPHKLVIGHSGDVSWWSLERWTPFVQANNIHCDHLIYWDKYYQWCGVYVDFTWSSSIFIELSCWNCWTIMNIVRQIQIHVCAIFTVQTSVYVMCHKRLAEEYIELWVWFCASKIHSSNIWQVLHALHFAWNKLIFNSY